MNKVRVTTNPTNGWWTIYEGETIIGEFIYLCDVSNMLDGRRNLFDTRAKRLRAEGDIAESAEAWLRSCVYSQALEDLHK